MSNGPTFNEDSMKKRRNDEAIWRENRRIFSRFVLLFMCLCGKISQRKKKNKRVFMYLSIVGNQFIIDTSTLTAQTGSRKRKNPEVILILVIFIFILIWKTYYVFNSHQHGLFPQFHFLQSFCLHFLWLYLLWHMFFKCFKRSKEISECTN